MHIPEPVDEIAGNGRLVLPVERLERGQRHGNRVDFPARARACHVSATALFHQFVSTDSCFWGTTYPEDKSEMVLSLDVLTPTALRLQLARYTDRLDRKTEMVASDIREAFSCEMTETEDRFTIDTGKMRILIGKKPYSVAVLDPSGTRVAELGGPERCNVKQYDALPTGFVQGDDQVRACENFRLEHDEEILGMGEQFLGMHRRGQTVRNWSEDAKGNHSPRMYKPIPFLLSTRGYGIFFNTSAPFTAWIGSQSAFEASFLIDEDVLDYYFFYGPSLPHVISQYTALTGRAPMPPKWSFGLWMSRNSYETAQEALQVAERIRKEKVPCDAIHFDPPWMGTDGSDCTLEPSPAWGDLEKTIQEMHALHLHVSLWQMPYMSDASPAFKEGLRHDAIVETSVPGAPPKRMGVIDFSRPEAITWYKGRLERLLRMGADCIKVDFGETAPINVKYHRYSGIEMHNLYALLYNRAAWEVTEQVKGRGNAIIWARPAYAGSQRYPIHWSGDADASFETLACVVKAGLSLALSGFSFWANDLGGYFSTPSSELYMRWTQFAFFCSHVRAHGGTPREPWMFGKEALANFRKYADLRYSLMPYILDEATFASEKGLPFIRPLVLDYQNDRCVWHIEDEFLFGRSLLVAPVLREGERSRKVYLPEGEWQDFWSGTVTPGCRWIERDAPLDILPLFIRRGTRIERTQGRQYVE